MESCSADRNTARISGDFSFGFPEMDYGSLDFGPDSSLEVICFGNKKHKDGFLPKGEFRVFSLF